MIAINIVKHNCIDFKFPLMYLYFLMLSFCPQFSTEFWAGSNLILQIVDITIFSGYFLVNYL